MDVNEDVHPKIQSLFHPVVSDGYIPLSEVLKAADQNFSRVRACEGFPDVICPAFSSGKCRNPRCGAAHLPGSKTPEEWVDRFVSLVSKGIDLVKQHGAKKYFVAKRAR